MKFFQRMLSLIIIAAFLISMQSGVILVLAEKADSNNWRCDVMAEGENGVTLSANAYYESGLLA